MAREINMRFYRARHGTGQSTKLRFPCRQHPRLHTREPHYRLLSTDRPVLKLLNQIQRARWAMRLLRLSRIRFRRAAELTIFA